MVGVRRPQLAPASEWSPAATTYPISRPPRVAGCRARSSITSRAERTRSCTVERNLAAFRRWQFVPQNLRDVGEVDTAIQLLGQRIPMPLLFSPTATRE